MANQPLGGVARAISLAPAPTVLTRQQIVGFWAAWFGWMLDGMDSVIYALVLGPALTELLPRSGIEATPRNIAFVGSLTFGLFLVGWGLSFIWGPIADKRKPLVARYWSMRCSPALQLLRPTSGCWRSSASSQVLASGASGPWPVPTLPRLGRRSGARWEPATCKPATILAFLLQRR